MIIISSIRFDVGFDYYGYYSQIFPNIDNDAIDRMEPAGKVISYISYSLKEPQLQFIIYSVITYAISFYTLWKYSPNFGISCIVYLSLFYLSSLGIIRQAAAVALILYSYRYIIDRKIIPYIICIFLATLFHTSAIIGIIFYPLINFLNPKILFIVILFGIFIFKTTFEIILTTNPLFNDYQYYLNKIDNYQGGNIIKYVYLLLSIIMTISSYVIKDQISLKISIISIIGCCFPFIIGGHLGGRMVDYFLIFYCITIPQILKHFKYNIRRIICEGLICYFLAGLYISTKNPDKSPYTPYQTILQINTKNPKFK